MPDVLLSGHHENIRTWRRQKSLEVTYMKRPELLENLNLTNEDKKYLENLKEGGK